jgi:thiamine-phosphate pyrophosphorylase
MSRAPPPPLAAAARRFRVRPPAPRLWLVSDPVRLPDPRVAAALLPPGGAAVLARGLAPAVLAGLATLARRRRLVLVIAGDGRLALRHRAGLHLADRPGGTRHLLPFLRARRGGGRHRRRWPMPLSVAAHGRAGIARARRLGADAVLLSPVFPTASHPGAPALGPWRWAALARRAGVAAVVALGGMDGRNARRLPRWAGGVAAIGALAGGP